MRRLIASRIMAVALYLLVVGLIVRTALNGAAAMGYNWQWYRIPQYLWTRGADGWQAGELLTGLGASILLSAAAFSLALGLGLVVALLRLSDLVVGRAVARLYLEIVRNVPLLVLLYVFYYVMGPIFGLDRYLASILCLGVYHAALVSEIVRAGINSVDTGQREAAAAIGLSRGQTYRFVILPQAVRLMLPPMTGEAVNLIKSSAIVSVIAVAELTTAGRNIISDTYLSFEIWFTVAALYLFVTLFLSLCVSRLERRLAVAT
ncbi:amino acid ABC transporter permease [Paracoccus spongiarum]|uniref:Amino acid ABC transporter permease n=1 Tax=Paracoccus spongiarum TaxID=3064387 RepID=A0ABT9JCG9_9RHOB|nr:amino acid ABC transporter permease [Paracoccus sp. 2205BS29-5]MDP5307528.1 amino acid ABC transporter permease [Paracoccus sp. 2205BS29-5]